MVCALLNVTGWLLSAMGQLNRVGYGVVLIASVAAGVFWFLRERPLFRTGFRLRRFRKVFPLAFGLLALLALAGGIIHAPSNYDALAYRTPRILHWLAEGQWHWIHTDFQRLNTRGCGIEWVSTPLLVLTGTDRLFFLINAVSFLLLPGICYSVMTGLGVSQKVAWHWMWIFPTGYCYLLQAGSIGNDLFGATLALAAVDFALRAGRERSASAAWLSILAAGLMTAGKGFNLLLLLPWGLALLPATFVLLRRPLRTLLIGIVFIFVSLAPTAVLNARYCGDWKGLNAEPSALSTGEPLLHLGANGVLVTIHNLSPTFFPFSSAWNGMVERIIPSDLALKLSTHFEEGGAKFKLGEIQMEESCGLGFGISLLLIPLFFGLLTPGAIKWSGFPNNLISSSLTVPAGAWLVTLYFFTQSGLGCPARYLAPSYVVLLAPALRSRTASTLLGTRWWRMLAIAGFALAALLLIASPPRPLWPARTLLQLLHAETSSSPLLRRAWNVYSVYGERSDGFAPVRAVLSPGLKVLGLVTFDDPETSLWRPFGARRIVHVTHDDDAASVRRRGIEQVLVSDYIISGHQKTTLAEWLKRYDAEVITSMDLSLRASRGPTAWHLVRLRPSPRDSISPE